MSVICEIDDLKKAARKRVPRMFFEYVDSGSWREITYLRNADDYAEIKFRQRVAVNMSNRSLQSELVGEPVRMPVALAPVGLSGMQYADGEIKAARAAEQFGVPYTLSTMSICSIEDVAENTTSPFWFQLYVMRDRDFVVRLIDRAKAAGCSALVVTLDLQILGQRHNDLRNGLGVPPKLTLASLMQILARPAWCANMLTTKRYSFGNIVGHVKGVEDLSSLASWTSEQFDPQLSWDDIEWIRKRWDGKLILKGILDPEDAKMAAKTGADAIIVSNHGGRQLDGTQSTIAALPPIIEAVGDDIEVHIDGGISCGQDALKAICLGAKGAYVGRAYTYGLGALGEAGVTRALEILYNEMDTTMALCGERVLSNMGRHNLLP